MAGITTAMTTQFKVDVLKGLHCFRLVIVRNGDTHTTVTVDGLANINGLAVGMAVSGSGVAANTVIARILSSTSVELSKATTTTVGATPLTFTADAFKLALIKHTPTGTYGAASVNYSDITGNSDETANSGTYAAGGFALTNVDPSNPSGVTAITNFSVNPSWTSATLDTDGCMIYNTSQRGETANRAVSLHDFGGEQKVTAGTLTLVLPTADAANAILRIA